jgi:hypothetical protein
MSDVVIGANVGRFTQSFSRVNADSTVVNLRIAGPATGLKLVLKPLFDAFTAPIASVCASTSPKDCRRPSSGASSPKGANWTESPTRRSVVSNQGLASNPGPLSGDSPRAVAPEVKPD